MSFVDRILLRHVNSSLVDLQNHRDYLIQHLPDGWSIDFTSDLDDAIRTLTALLIDLTDPL